MHKLRTKAKPAVSELKPPIPCPASSLTPIGFWEALKITLATITLVAPIKLLIILFLLTIGWGIARLATIGIDSADVRTPKDGWRRLAVYPMRLGVRVIMYVAGFYYVQVRGELDGRSCLFVCTHHSLWDSLWLFYYTGASQAAKLELFSMPVMGDFLRALSSIPIDRHTTQGRRAAVLEIQHRAVDNRFPPILVFPTGCCSNARQLIEFKRGAFEAGVPIQPIGISYPARDNDLIITRSMLWDLYRSLCQAVNWLTITFMPIRFPDSLESKDPTLWASHVRNEMALRLGMQKVDGYRFETELFRVRCRDAGIPFNETKCVISNLRLAEAVLDAFVAMDSNTDGFIDISEISATLPLSVEFDQKDFELILPIIKMPQTPLTENQNPEFWPNIDSWMDTGLIGAVTGGRARLRPRPMESYSHNKFEIAEIINYFNQVSAGTLPRNPFLLELFNVSL